MSTPFSVASALSYVFDGELRSSKFNFAPILILLAWKGFLNGDLVLILAST